MKHLRSIAALLAAVVLAFLPGCNKDKEGETAVTDISIYPSTLTLSIGESQTLTATVTPSNATEVNLSWLSSDTKVVTVSGSGTTAQVIGVAAGNATVTASAGGKTATVSVTVSDGYVPPAIPAPEGTVDMGLPSGTFWAEVNLGASAPSEPGNTFTWCDYTKDEKYNDTDGLSLLEAVDDRATQALGEGYRTPTLGEWVELLNPAYCTVEETSRNGEDGLLVTSKRTGKSIFLLKDRNYWSSTVKKKYDFSEDREVFEASAWQISLKYAINKEGSVFWSDWFIGRGQNLYIRPVYAQRPVIATGISTTKDKVEMLRGDWTRLSATVQPSSANQTVLWTANGREDKRGYINNYSGEVTPYFGLVDRVYAIDGTCGHIAWTDLTPKFPSVQPEAIDLGLPSGTKWASCDLGSTYPEQLGFYFAWGETACKWNYNESTYKWYNGSSYTKYKSANSYLESDDDAAAKLLGGSWRIPTREQMQELIDRTTMELVTQNNMKGLKVTGPNKKTIFLPLSGTISNYTLTNGVDSEIHYSTNECSSEAWCYIGFYRVGEGFQIIDINIKKTRGLTIRPVQPKY